MYKMTLQLPISMSWIHNKKFKLERKWSGIHFIIDAASMTYKFRISKCKDVCPLIRHSLPTTLYKKSWIINQIQAFHLMQVDKDSKTVICRHSKVWRVIWSQTQIFRIKEISKTFSKTINKCSFRRIIKNTKIPILTKTSSTTHNHSSRAQTRNRIIQTYMWTVVKRTFKTKITRKTLLTRILATMRVNLFTWLMVWSCEWSRSRVKNSNTWWILKVKFTTCKQTLSAQPIPKVLRTLTLILNSSQSKWWCRINHRLEDSKSMITLHMVVKQTKIPNSITMISKGVAIDRDFLKFMWSLETYIRY